VGPVPPEEAKKIGYRCRVCSRQLTKGVDDRVEELADRRYGYRPPSAIDFIYLLPLQELIATALGVSLSSEQRLYSPKIWETYNRIVEAFGNEFRALMDAPEEALRESASDRVARLIMKLRRKEVEIIPGFDGTYGRIFVKEEAEEEPREARDTERRGLQDFL